ncbi:MAG: disulfide oxidoreductase [Deltaproteobacteria bacterium]|nr:MAG: disulfide oxidoreductase [Deltaproteobacteria bacterium]
MGKDGPIRAETLVGDIVREHPALREKIRELFGPECLSCKSSRHESVTYTSWHRGLDPKKVVNELNALLKK